MKTVLCVLVALASIVVAVNNLLENESHPTGRDYAYEAYCDSIWVNDPDYYVDVLSESDKYVTYVSIYGEWWNK